MQDTKGSDETSGSFDTSVTSFVRNGLIPFATRELSRVRALLFDPDTRVRLDITATPAFQSAIAADDSGSDGNDVVLTLSTGVLVRLSYLAQVLVEANASAYQWRMHHATMFQPDEIAFRSDLQALSITLMMCPRLTPLFSDDYESASAHWSALIALAHGPLTTIGGQNRPGDIQLPAVMSGQAHTVAFHALRFHLFHELAHAGLGHLAYRQSVGPRLSDAQERALELDADIQAGILVMMRCIENTQGSAPDAALLLGSFVGLAVALLLMDVSMRSAFSYHKSRYLVPDLRYVLMADFAEKRFARTHYPARDIRRAWQSAMFWCKIATDQLGMTGGAFFTIDRELFINWLDDLPGYELLRIEEPVLTFGPHEESTAFKALSWVDEELRTTLEALTGLQPHLQAHRPKRGA